MRTAALAYGKKQILLAQVVCLGWGYDSAWVVKDAAVRQAAVLWRFLGSVVLYPLVVLVARCAAAMFVLGTLKGNENQAILNPSRVGPSLLELLTSVPLP